ncbi:MAG: prolyl oligopeptidase family serine peptidase [Phycisphaerales bacterium JB063]
MTHTPRRRLTALAWLLVLCPACLADAQDAPPPRTGTFNTTFDQRSPLSRTDAMAEVGRWDPRQLTDWDLADVEFQMIVPDGYTGEEAYGLLVFIHPYDDVDATSPRVFFFGRVIADVLAEHQIIWVSFDAGGNGVLPNKRLGLALDAVHNVTQRYNIDDQRVYVSGMSGGGRMTCMAGIYYPQVFTGCVPIVGSMYFRQVPVPEDPELRALIRPEPGEHAVWPRTLWAPRRDVLREMKATQRWVLLTGDADFNMPEMRSHFEHGFQRDGFEHAHYLEIPGMDHAFPDAQAFEQAIEHLDAPLRDGPNEADGPAGDTPQQRHDEQQAQRRLQAAERMLGPDPARALTMLQRLVERYPETNTAERARELIAELENAPPDAEEDP